MLYYQVLDELTLGAFVRAFLVTWLVRLYPNDDHRARAFWTNNRIRHLQPVAINLRGDGHVCSYNDASVTPLAADDATVHPTLDYRLTQPK